MVAKKAKVVPATAPTAETSAALADHPVLVALADAKVTLQAHLKAMQGPGIQG